MSLWTPSGEHRIPDERPAAPQPDLAETPAGRPGRRGVPPGADDPGADDPGADDPGADDPGAAAAVDELRRQLADAPAEVVVANHCYGLFELAAVYLSQQPPLLDQARLAVDALGCIVDGLGERLGEAHGPLQEALAQVRLAYVQIDATARSVTD
ncbi:MAG: hypothetical protein ACYDHU_01705 [Acidimicrobiales bacterium]